MSKKQALTEFHRGSILAAAERLFTAKGVEKTTMDDIAKEAEYSKATLYVYFESKEEIVNAIYLNGMQMLRKRITDALQDEKDWRAAYGKACGAVTRFHEENPATYGAVAGELTAADGIASGVKGCREINQVSDQVISILSEFLRWGEAEGYLKLDLDVRETVLLLWAALSGMVRMSRRRGEYLRATLGIERNEFLQHGAEFILNSVLK